MLRIGGRFGSWEGRGRLSASPRWMWGWKAFFSLPVIPAQAGIHRAPWSYPGAVGSASRGKAAPAGHARPIDMWPTPMGIFAARPERNLASGRFGLSCSMPTLRQLEYLVALADLRHFGRAAQASNISQPSLSQQVRALEQRLGVVLVERNQTGVELTPIGREIAERARPVILAVKDIADLARQAQDGLAGTIRFGVTPTLGPYLMSDVISALHRKQPHLRLYIREGIPQEQALELSRGQLDMLLGPLPIAGEDLEIEPLFRERLHIVAAPDHELANRPSIGKGDLVGTGVLSLHSAHHLHRQVAAFCTDLGMLLLRDYEGTSLDSLRQMAGTGLGLTVLPELYIRSEVGGSSGVRILAVDDWHPVRSIAAAWRRGAAYSDAYRTIAACIAEEARRLLA